MELESSSVEASQNEGKEGLENDETMEEEEGQADEQ